MNNFFLNAKHWHIFVMIVGIPFLFQILFMGSMIFSAASGNIPDVESIFKYLYFLPVLLILVGVAFYGWFWSIAIGLQPKVPANVEMKTGKFKFFFFFPIFYFLVIMLLVAYGISAARNNSLDPSPELIIATIAIVLPMHLFTIFCSFHSMYFVAKTLKTVELQREVSFSDFAAEFFLLWFYIIGIWIIQPKVNKMANTDYDVPLEGFKV